MTITVSSMLVGVLIGVAASAVALLITALVIGNKNRKAGRA